MNLVNVRVKKLHPNAVVPSYQSEGASGLDLHACLDSDVFIGSHGRAVIPTGIAFEIPLGFEGQVRPRSGLASNFGIVAVLGTIDSDYRGPVGAIMVNLNIVPVRIEPGQRIAQIVFVPVRRAYLELVDELSDTVRGAGGFGSTGAF